MFKAKTLFFTLLKKSSKIYLLSCKTWDVYKNVNEKLCGLNNNTCNQSSNKQPTVN